MTLWVLAKRDIDSSQREQRVAGQLTVENRAGLGTGTHCKRGNAVKKPVGSEAAWLTFDKFGVLFNIGSACQHNGALVERGFRIWLLNGRRYILKLKSHVQT